MLLWSDINDGRYILYLCPSWNKLNSTSVASRTVRAVTAKHSLSVCGGKTPCKRTSFQSDLTLQTSIQSKYLLKKRKKERIHAIRFLYKKITLAYFKNNTPFNVLYTIKI